MAKNRQGLKQPELKILCKNKNEPKLIPIIIRHFHIRIWMTEKKNFRDNINSLKLGGDIEFIQVCSGILKYKY